MGEIISKTADIEFLREKIAFRRINGIQSIFRGQANREWAILSPLQRCLDKFPVNVLWDNYISAYDEYLLYIKKFGWEKFKPLSENYDFYYLTIARHLGMTCNLVDWTSSLDLALLIACIDFPDNDGCLYVLSGNLNINKRPIESSPFNIEKSIIVCKAFDFIDTDYKINDMPLGRMRRFRQNGFFSIISQNELFSDFNTLLPKNITIERIIIPKQIKSEIIKFLSERGCTKEIYLLDSNKINPIINFVNKLNSKYFKFNQYDT